MPGRTIAYTITCPVCRYKLNLRSREKRQCAGCGTVIGLEIGFNGYEIRASGSPKEKLKRQEEK